MKKNVSKWVGCGFDKEVFFFDWFLIKFKKLKESFGGVGVGGVGLIPRGRGLTCISKMKCQDL